jgi:hypothetical protein
VKALLAWSLDGARRQTLSLTRGIPATRACAQASPGEHHPAWTLGHLLLGDAYLLTLLGADALPRDFQILLDRYGPGASPVDVRDRYDELALLVERLTETGARRLAALDAMAASDLARPTPDPALVTSQPTLGHHLQALVFHEGYHAGRVAAWRRHHGLPAVDWAFAPRRS